MTRNIAERGKKKRGKRNLFYMYKNPVQVSREREDSFDPI